MTAIALSPLSEMQGYVRAAAGETGRIKERINRAARKLGIGYSRARDLYYADERCSVRADELASGRSLRVAGRDGCGNVRPAGIEGAELVALVAALEGVATALHAQGHGDAADHIRRAQAATRLALAETDHGGAR